jgi:leucyl/phenylalanyl-tRNA--protein transferase
MFAGESMFYRSRDASKVALFHLCEHLKQQGVPWIDCQVLSPLLASFGAVEIARREFMELLHEQIHRPAITFPRDSVP